MLSRRTLLGSGASLAVSGCVARPCPPLALFGAAVPAPLIDAHTHLFNLKDLSAVRFISYVVAEQYPELAELPLSPEDPTLLDRFVMAVLRVAGAKSAPSARHEQAVLTQVVTVPPAGQDPSPTPVEADQQERRERLSRLLQGRDMEPDNLAGEQRLRAIAYHAGGGGAPIDDLDPPYLPADEADAVARQALSDQAQPGLVDGPLGSFDLRGLFHFAGQLKRYRHCLVDEVTQFHIRAGQQPLLLVPAMVDFGRWLRDDPEAGSTFPEQIKTWHIISKRAGPAAVHGYVGYCPLRQVQFDRGRFGPARDQIDTPCHHDPMAVVREALNARGFIGVKLYPPMGFRAANNASRTPSDYPFAQEVLDDTFGEAVPESDLERRTTELGQMLDEALERLYRCCVELKAPIMAHGANSVSANRQTGQLADPAFWEPVMRRASPPSVMLAHFGGFTDRSSATPHDDLPNRPADVCTDRERPPLAGTWEAWVARYVQAHPDKPLYADISYFVDILDDACRAVVIDDLRALAEPNPSALARKLVFGTDWVMLAQEPGIRPYSRRTREFLQAVFGPDVEAIMRTNFLAFAGLRPGSPTFERISRCYDGDPQLLDRLTRACQP